MISVTGLAMELVAMAIYTEYDDLSMLVCDIILLCPNAF